MELAAHRGAALTLGLNPHDLPDPLDPAVLAQLSATSPLGFTLAIHHAPGPLSLAGRTVGDLVGTDALHQLSHQHSHMRSHAERSLLTESLAMTAAAAQRKRLFEQQTNLPRPDQESDTDTDTGQCGLCKPHGLAMSAEQIAHQLTGRELKQNERDALAKQLPGAPGSGASSPPRGPASLTDAKPRSHPASGRGYRCWLDD